MHIRPLSLALALAAGGLTSSTNALAATEGEWTFDQNLSDQIFVDDSANGNDLTRGATTSPDTQDPGFSSDTPHGGAGNFSVEFDGTDDLGWRNDNATLNPTGELTASAWVKLDDLTLGGGATPGSNQDIIFSNIGAFGTSGGIQLGFGNGNDPGLFFLYRDASFTDRVAGTNLAEHGWTADTWYHVAATYDEVGANADLRLFIDGKPVASATTAGQVVYNNTDFFLLGTNVDGAGSVGGCCDRELDGHLDQVMLHSHELSDADIRDLAAIDIRWDNAVGGNASTRTDWDPDKLPTYASRAILQDLGGAYTVDLDADDWELLDLHIEDQAEANLHGFTITTEEGVDLSGSGKLTLGGAQVLGNGTLTTSSASLVQGHGSIALDSTIAGELAANSSGNTLTLAGEVNNQGAIYSDGGDLTVSGTIRALPTNNGDFDARDGRIDITGTIETGASNSFSADAGGELVFDGSLNTGNLAPTRALGLNGGSIDLSAGATLTNAAGKEIVGTGTLLSAGRNLINQHLIEAQGGTLTVHGTITNNNTMRAEGSGDELVVASSLHVTGGAQVYAQGGGQVDLQSPLVNDGDIYVANAGAVLSVADTGVTGSGQFRASTGGTFVFADGFSNAGLSDSDALVLEGGRIATEPGGTLTNAIGRRIQGFGTLLASGSPAQTLSNQGTVATLGGDLDVEGDLVNTGELHSLSSDSLRIGGTLSNDGTVAVNDGSELQAGGISAGTGSFSLNGGRLISTGDLALAAGATILDNGLTSAVEVMGGLSKQAGAAALFDADQVALDLHGRDLVTPLPHQIDWRAEDRGAEVGGLINNLAWGLVTFGNGIGDAASDGFDFSAETILYAFGLVIESDALLDLGGATLYYLQAGDRVNGITGTGFQNQGQFINGQIIEIDADAVATPTPAALALLLTGIALMPRRRSPRR